MTLTETIGYYQDEAYYSTGTHQRRCYLTVTFLQELEQARDRIKLLEEHIRVIERLTVTDP
jgi:hypothetical protein